MTECSDEYAAAGPGGRGIELLSPVRKPCGRPLKDASTSERRPPAAGCMDPIAPSSVNSSGGNEPAACPKAY